MQTTTFGTPSCYDELVRSGRGKLKDDEMQELLTALILLIIQSKLVSIFVQTLLYGGYNVLKPRRLMNDVTSLGIFSVLFVISIWVLRRKMEGGTGMGTVMFWVAVTMWVLATMVSCSHMG